jgi:hypothetical protein
MFNDELVDNINCKIFAKEPKIELDDRTYAYQKHLLRPDFVRFPNGSDNYYHCCNQKELYTKRMFKNI